MVYELTLTLQGGWIEIEGDTIAQLEKRIQKIDVPRLEKAMRAARRGAARKSARKAARRR